MISENELVEESSKAQDFVYDIEEALIQYKRPFTRPLCSENVPKDCSFSSWRGRSFCLYQSGKLIFREPFRILKHIITLITSIALLCLDTLNFSFSAEARENFCRRFTITFGYAFNLLFRPIGFISDISKLILGAFIYPKIAIGPKIRPA